jgi:hypothetical protein
MRRQLEEFNWSYFDRYTLEDARDTLIAAQLLIDEPTAWTKYNAACDADGVHIDATKPGAVCFCSIGAVFAFENQVSKQAKYAARDVLNAASGSNSAVAYNDRERTTHADVQQMFGRAITACEQELDRRATSVL